MNTPFQQLCQYVDKYGVDAHHLPCVFDISPEGEPLPRGDDNLYRYKGRVVHEQQRMGFSLTHLHRLWRMLPEEHSDEDENSENEQTELEIETRDQMSKVISHMCDINNEDEHAEPGADPRGERARCRAEQKRIESAYMRRVRQEREEYFAQKAAAQDDRCAGKRSSDSDGESRRPRVDV
jgi:hypothetical protein